MNAHKLSKKAPFAVGDRVTSGYIPREKTTIRKILKITECCQSEYGSGWFASADGGEVCPTCGLQGTPINCVDSAWFEKVK